jgi:hypothetical protein
MRRHVVFVLGLLGVVACFSDGSTPAGGPDASSGVTYYKDVAPIVQRVCQNCHVQGGIAPFPLLTYDDAKTEAAAIVSDTQARIMPPFPARSTSECQPRYAFAGDWSLSDAEIATIKAWHDGGDVAGNPNDAPPPNTTPPVTDLPNATSIAPAIPYSLPSTSVTDDFRCFVLDPGITAQTYLTGTNIKPGNKTIVHHALIFEVPPGATIPPPDDPNVPDQYTCFGDAGVAGEQLLAAWAPGGLPYQYPATVAHPLAAGTKFVMQIHYHPHSNAVFAPDTTTFQFSTTDQAPAWTVGTALLGNFTKAVNASGTGLQNPPFLIQPDQSGQVFTMQYTEPALYPQVRILAVAPHMHLVGSDEKIMLYRANAQAPDPASECLVQVPKWNFDWQRAYEYDVTDLSSLPLFSPGDQLTIRCTYDNTMSNTQLAQSLAENGQTQTQPVTIGDTTTDEMCLGAFWYVYPTP